MRIFIVKINLVRSVVSLFRASVTNEYGKSKKATPKFIYELTLDEFLEIIKIPDAEKLYYPVGCFPTDKHFDDFLATIHTRNEKEVKDILRHFIPKSGTCGADHRIFKSLHFNADWVLPNTKTLEEQAATNDRHIEDTEYYRRLHEGMITGGKVWEGMIWVLEVLPNSPDQAIKALDAYARANFQFW